MSGTAGPVVALVGPTGAGKSALALEAAEHLDAEIVAVDAFTIYRGMDTGTATPTRAERRRVRHHCLDLLEASEECSVEWFQRVARQAIAEVHARGRTALLVGGSGLYFRAVVDPLRFPPTDAVVRAAVEGAYAGDPGAAHAELARRDPDAAARIDPANLRRTVRALEVVRLTGEPFSAWRTEWDAYVPIYEDLRVIGVAIDRAELARRIDDRVASMLGGGLVEECRRLREQPLSTTARQAIGYAEVLAALETDAQWGDLGERMAARTRRYAARQQRWFATDPRVRWTPREGIVDALCDHDAPSTVPPA